MLTTSTTGSTSIIDDIKRKIVKEMNSAAMIILSILKIGTIVVQMKKMYRRVLDQC